MSNRYLKVMQGLGDTVYARPFVKYLASQHKLYVETSWPELFADIDVNCVKPENLKLRTQGKNILKSEYLYTHSVPTAITKEDVHYGPNIQTSNILTEINKRVGIPSEHIKLDLDVIPKISLNKGKPVAVVRPVTERAEWHNSARSPLPEYVEQVTQHLMETHHVISVADLEHGQEWALQKRMFAHQAFHHGELSMWDMLQLMRSADIVVGGVGFIVPLGIATGVKTFVICGGQGGYNHPSVINSPYQDTSNMYYAVPDSMCMCTDMRHKHCNKAISNLMDKFNAFIRG